MSNSDLDSSNIEGNAIEIAGAMLESAEAVVDTQFGAGYAEKHPAIVAGFVQACATFYLAERIADSLQSLTSNAEGMHICADSIRISLDDLVRVIPRD